MRIPHQQVRKGLCFRELVKKKVVNKKEEILAHVELAGHSYAPQLGALKFSEQFHKAAHSDHRKLRQGKAENTS